MIRYFGENIRISFFKNRRVFTKFLKQLLLEKNYKLGDINFIFCDDEYLLSINQQYLKHDYYTDTITFNYNSDNMISGDIFISVDRVRENSTVFNTEFGDELYRVMIHGFLHLLGYEDKKNSGQNNEMIILQEQLVKRFFSYYVSRETF